VGEAVVQSTESRLSKRVKATLAILAGAAPMTLSAKLQLPASVARLQGLRS
jgi:hypothetical protein